MIPSSVRSATNTSLDLPRDLVRSTVIDLIRQDHGDWSTDGYICLQDLNRYRGLYVQKVLETEHGELSSLEQEVVQSVREHELLAANINDHFDSSITFGERLADGVARFGGSWTFIIIFVFSNAMPVIHDKTQHPETDVSRLAEFRRAGDVSRVTLPERSDGTKF